jgi:hypothetical protein
MDLLVLLLWMRATLCLTKVSVLRGSHALEQRLVTFVEGGLERLVRIFNLVNSPLANRGVEAEAFVADEFN